MNAVNWKRVDGLDFRVNAISVSDELFKVGRISHLYEGQNQRFGVHVYGSYVIIREKQKERKENRGKYFEYKIIYFSTYMVSYIRNKCLSTNRSDDAQWGKIR